MTTPEPRRGRVIALRAVAATFVLIGLVALNGSMLMPWLAWLPEHTLTSLGLPESDVLWIVQGTAIIAGNSALIVCVALQLRKPAANVAALWIVIAILGSQIVLDTVQRDYGSPLWLVVYALFVALVALHPRRLAPVLPIDPFAAAVVMLGAVPFAAYAWGELRQQFAPADPPDNFHFGMALVAMVVVLSAALGATALPGRRVAVVIAVVIPVLLATASIAHPSQPSALPGPWAWAAIAWSVALLAVDRRQAFGRRTARAQVPASSGGAP